VASLSELLLYTRHTAGTGQSDTGICDNVFIIVPLSEGLPLTTEIKQVLKQDLDLDLDVPKFNCYFPVIESTTTSIHVLFSKCSVHQSSVRMSVRYGRRHLHDGVTCHRGAHWQ